ncbi:MAG: CYTH and CHAD domain-containing protein [Rhodocyclaceae bacterium]
MANEIELKLAFPASAHERVLAHPLIAAAPRLEAPALLINTYFDTPDFDLRRQRMAVRTRRVGERWLQTIKCASASVGGLSARPEWEHDYVDERFDFSHVDDPAARQLLEHHAARIAPVFTTDFQRDTRVATPRDGVRILIMIDQGLIEANGRSQVISEVELELAEGSPLDLFEFALQLASALPLLPEDASKAQRGFELFEYRLPAPQRSGQARVDPQASTIAAFKTLAYDCLNAWQANITHARTESGSGFIHQARVALRRLRSLVRAFAPALPAEFVDHWTPLLRELAGRLGAARDLDVLRTAIVAPLARTGEVFDQEVASRLLNRANQEADVIHAAIRADLSEAGTGVPMLSLARALYLLADTAPVDLPTLAREAARHTRKVVHKRLAAAHAGADSPDTPLLHPLRIACKRLRYTLDALAPVLGDKAAQRHARQLAKAQRELGYLNDLRTAQTVLAEWAQDDIALFEARAYLMGWHAERAARARRKVLTRLAAVVGQA